MGNVSRATKLGGLNRHGNLGSRNLAIRSFRRSAIRAFWHSTARRFLVNTLLPETDNDHCQPRWVFRAANNLHCQPKRRRRQDDHGDQFGGRIGFGRTLDVVDRHGPAVQRDQRIGLPPGGEASVGDGGSPPALDDPFGN